LQYNNTHNHLECHTFYVNLVRHRSV